MRRRGEVAGSGVVGMLHLSDRDESRNLPRQIGDEQLRYLGSDSSLVRFKSLAAADGDGVHPWNLSLLLYGRPSRLPASPEVGAPETLLTPCRDTSSLSASISRWSCSNSASLSARKRRAMRIFAWTPVGVRM